MKNQCKRFMSGTAITAFCICVAGSSFADGYRNPPPTAEGIGKSGVNSVWVDDASAISYNPANLAFQTDKSLVISTTFAQTENKYKNPFAPSAVESDGAWNVLPNIYYSQPVGSRGMVMGLGITTPFGQGLSWSRSDFVPAAAPNNTVLYDASVAVININPTVAFPITDDLSVGLGLDLYASKLEFTAVNGLIVPGPGQIFFDSEVEAYGTALGGNLGVSWNIAEAHRLTATYQSSFEIDYSGDFKVGGFPDADFDTTIKFPNIYSLGYGIQLTEDIQIEAMIEWLQWSNNDKQTLEIEGQPPAIFPNNWDDTITFGLGGSWQALDSLVVRAGYAFIETPIPDETITPLLPDADRHAISFGLGYAFGGHNIDLAYTFSIYEDRTAPSGGAGPGTYEIDSNLVGMTYSLSF